MWWPWPECTGLYTVRRDLPSLLNPVR
jgi:hypothetical protein